MGLEGREGKGRFDLKKPLSCAWVKTTNCVTANTKQPRMRRRFIEFSLSAGSVLPCLSSCGGYKPPYSPPTESEIPRYFLPSKKGVYKEFICSSPGYRACGCILCRLVPR